MWKVFSVESYLYNTVNVENFARVGRGQVLACMRLPQLGETLQQGNAGVYVSWCGVCGEMRAFAENW